MEGSYTAPIFILILNVFLIIVLRLKRMALLKSLNKLESKNTRVFICYSIGHIKYMFQKNGEDMRHFRFSVKGEIVLKHQSIYGDFGTGIKIKPLNINLGGRFFKFLETDLDRTVFTVVKKKFKNK